MPTRRQVIAALAAVGLAGCGTPRHPTAAGGALTVTAGSVTDPTGSLNGVSFTDLADVAVHQSGSTGVWQDVAVLSNYGPDPQAQYGGPGERLLANQVVQGEKWLLVTMAAARTDNNPLAPLGPPPTGVQFYVNAAQTHGDGIYELNPNAAVHSSRCAQTVSAPTGGWVQYSRYDDPATAGALVEGTYDLTRGTDHVTGTFSAPRVTGTPTSGKPACLVP